LFALKGQAIIALGYITEPLRDKKLLSKILSQCTTQKVG
jgi:hypothetical protein